MTDTPNWEYRCQLSLERSRARREASRRRPLRSRMIAIGRWSIAVMVAVALYRLLGFG